MWDVVLTEDRCLWFQRPCWNTVSICAIRYFHFTPSAACIGKLPAY